MINLIGTILCSSIKNLFDNQPDILTNTSMTGMTEWNLGHHLANEIHKYIFWLNNDVDVTKRNVENRRPDIIFHKRGINALNFLVIELKHQEVSCKKDIGKIKEDWMGSELCYKFGASINISDKNRYKVIVFQGDEKCIFNQSNGYIPLKILTESEQKPFITLVDKILSLAQSDDYLQNSVKQAEVKEYKHKIDQMVYKLYDLTPEEIAIVEGKRRMPSVS